jgi:hypothetical protein
MEQVAGARAGAGEQLDPGSDEPFVGGIVDGGEDAIGCVRAILVGGLEGNGRGQWLRKLQRGRVVERVDVDPGEEARRVGRPARLSERARGERRLPACGRQCARERAGDLRRAAARKEEERRDDESCAPPAQGRRAQDWCFHPESSATCTVRFSSVSRTRQRERGCRCPGSRSAMAGREPFETRRALAPRGSA